MFEEAKNSDDYLMVFDDLKNKSGFVVPLPERFKTEIDRIKEVSNYGLTNISIGSGGEKTDIYFKILSEIIDYPKNMERIAKTVCDMWQKFEYVDKLFTSKSNGELLMKNNNLTENPNLLKAFDKKYVKSVLKFYYNYKKKKKRDEDLVAKKHLLSLK